MVFSIFPPLQVTTAEDLKVNASLDNKAGVNVAALNRASTVEIEAIFDWQKNIKWIH